MSFKNIDNTEVRQQNSGADICQCFCKNSTQSDIFNISEDLGCHKLNQILQEQFQSTGKVLRETSEELIRVNRENVSLKKHNKFLNNLLKGEENTSYRERIQKDNSMLSATTIDGEHLNHNSPNNLVKN